jgi:PKD repeat protein
MIFVNCTFTGETADCYLHDNSTVMACTFSGGPCMKVEGNDITLENNTGTWNEDAGISGGSGCTGLVIRDNSIVSGCINVSAVSVLENNTFEAPVNVYCYSSPDNVIRNNEITNADGTIRLSGQVNTNYVSGCGNVELGYDCEGTIILNNFIDCADIRLYPATYNTSSPVTYTYRSIEYTGYLGNYYSTFDGEDNNIDGVCEDAFVSSCGGSDTYPLVGPWIADGNNIETPGLTTCITPADSLQETIYAAESGDTIMMAPGTYNVSLVDGSVDLYINKSDLTFIAADGGEVIISPEDGDSEPTIWPGKADANDAIGCDASGITFNGITFEPFYIAQYDLSSYPPNADFSEMSFIGCTFTGSKSYYYLRTSSSVVNCTFNGGPKIYILGDDSRFEGNTGDCKGYGGFYVQSSGLIVRNNSIASVDVNGVGSVLLENNVFEAPSYFQLTNYDNIFCNNEFINGSSTIKLHGNVFMNNFTNYYSVNLRSNDNTNIYLNNLIDCTRIKLYSTGTYNTSSPVSYTYAGQEYTGYLGNYYSSYTGTDSNGDGVGDESISFGSGTDSYPLMGAWNADDNEIEVVAPEAEFSADVTSGDAPLTVNFSDASTDAENWSWDLDGDGVEDSNETNPQFTYAEAGTYNVTLTVSNSAGSDTETKVGYITCIQPLPVLSFAPVGASVSENHYTDIDITVSSLPDGLSGYNFTVSIADPGVAEIVGISYPSWANLTENSSLPGSSVYLKTLDGNSQLEAGAEDVVLATITVYGKEMGSTNLTLDIHRLDDDTGSEIEAELAVGTLEVTMTAIPGQTNSPQDLDGDGFYEDMTGDGSFSFVDVEVFFHQMDWIEDNLPVGDFDLNSNGRIDFDDIVDMFQMLA